MINHKSSCPEDLTVLFLWNNVSCKRTKSSLSLICIPLFQKDRGYMTEDKILKRVERVVQYFFLSKLIFVCWKLYIFKLLYHNNSTVPEKLLYAAESFYTFIMEGRIVLYRDTTILGIISTLPWLLIGILEQRQSTVTRAGMPPQVVKLTDQYGIWHRQWWYFQCLTQSHGQQNPWAGLG